MALVKNPYLTRAVIKPIADFHAARDGDHHIILTTTEPYIKSSCKALVMQPRNHQHGSEGLSL